MKIDLGTFEIESGELLIGDPVDTLELEKDCNFKSVMRGNWIAYVEVENGVQILHISHEDFKNMDSLQETTSSFIPIYSGQLGIFDKKFFQNNGIIPKDDRSIGKELLKNDRWYSMCCSRTENNIGGIIPFGVVIASDIEGSVTPTLSRICGTIVQITVDLNKNIPIESMDIDDKEDDEDNQIN